jgi:hypothetical protein
MRRLYGQLDRSNSNDVIKGFNQYDESAQGIVNITEG